MTQSPYRGPELIHPRITALSEFIQTLAWHREERDCGHRDYTYRAEALLTIADVLAGQCQFLEGKLRFKKDEYNKLILERDLLEERVNRQDVEILSLKDKLAKIEERDSNHESRAESDDSSVAAQTTNSRKRSAETDSATEKQDVKKCKESEEESEAGWA
ncbi:MAG: hypothetical protein Q9219_007190 [cf. Caloplaca sp. 3 TL-2023]